MSMKRTGRIVVNSMVRTRDEPKSDVGQKWVRIRDLELEFF